MWWVAVGGANLFGLAFIAQVLDPEDDDDGYTCAG